MSDIIDFFREASESFTIYVVEQRFAVNRGYEYFKLFRGKNNYILNDQAIKKQINISLRWIQKNIPNVAELIKELFKTATSPINIVDVISALSKLFGTHEHQAVGPEVLNPIIIQEGDVSRKYLSQIIALHQSSPLQPVIIIILKDNNFDRAKELLSNCPHDTNVKMIRNSGKCDLYKIINTGANCIDEFLDAFSRQCFSSCSRTKRDILLNKEWSENSVVKSLAPLVFKIRSNLILDDKKDAVPDIRVVLSKIQDAQINQNDVDKKVSQSLKCMCKLFNIYCHDYGGDDINEAYDLAKHLDNELLMAHVMRYAHFFNASTMHDKCDILGKASAIFSNNGVEDHAIYCTNNRLTYQFYSDSVKLREFREMQEEAVNNVPGLVGMSIIYNNVGVAHLYSGQPDAAIEYFNKGLDYSKDRIKQKIALNVNTLIAKEYSYLRIDENELRRTMKYIFDTCSIDYLPFLVANYAINTLSICMRNQPDLAREFLTTYPIYEVCRNALTPNQLGSGSLVKQLELLSSKYSYFNIEDIILPSEKSSLLGLRKNFLERNGLNPTIFNAWL